jgi:hypothetical protein
VSAQLVGAGVVDPLSQQPPAGPVSLSTEPKLKLKSMGIKLIEQKRVERAKKDTFLKDLVEDAKLMKKVNETVPSQYGPGGLSDLGT